MRLGEWGEAGMLAWLAEQLGEAHTPAWAEVGVGDDAAVFHLPRSGEVQLVCTCDAMVEGVHFLPEHSAESLARRLLFANLSDLAAMGARPRVALLTLGAPEETPRAWLEAFFTALRDACRAEETWLAGGDLSKDFSRHLSLFLLGEVEAGRALRMDSAAPGEDLWVTGSLGDSYLGLQLLARPVAGEAAAGFVAVYREGRQRWREMRRLVEAGRISAATDLSDGLAVDLPRLCRASGCAARVEVESLPTAPGFDDLTSQLECDKLTACLAGGEDFEILFTAAPSERESFARAAEAMELRLTRIGSIRAGRPGEVDWRDEQGRELRLNVEGYDHFRGTL